MRPSNHRGDVVSHWFGTNPSKLPLALAFWDVNDKAMSSAATTAVERDIFNILLSQRDSAPGIEVSVPHGSPRNIGVLSGDEIVALIAYLQAQTQ